ncbi:MAG: hypothetical protein WB870_13555 [Gallionellaceae bacterium]
MSSHMHVVIPNLFLPQGLAAECYAGLRLPALEKLLARAQPEPLLQDTLEAWMCSVFGIRDGAIAPVTLRADGLEPGSNYWLRADPVCLHLRRDQLVLQSGLDPGMDEAEQLCSSLNRHFAGTGMHFVAPHPQRWYLQLDSEPDLITQPISRVAGKDVHKYLPDGKDALHWHGVLNEIQMLLFEHEVNLAREDAGKLPVNSVWLWGGGHWSGQLTGSYRRMMGDSDLAAAFAGASGIPYEPFHQDVLRETGKAEQVLIAIESLHRAMQRGDIHAWRNLLLNLEQNIAAPLLQALQTGKVGTVTLDILQEGAAQRFVINRRDLWKFWRLPASLDKYALV